MNFSTCHATWKRSVFRALRGPTVEQFCRIVLQSKLCKVSICKTIFCARELHWLGWNYRDVCGRLDCISIGMFTGMSPGNSYGEYSGMSAEGGIPPRHSSHQRDPLDSNNNISPPPVLCHASTFIELKFDCKSYATIKYQSLASLRDVHSARAYFKPFSCYSDSVMKRGRGRGRPVYDAGDISGLEIRVAGVALQRNDGNAANVSQRLPQSDS